MWLELKCAVIKLSLRRSEVSCHLEGIAEQNGELRLNLRSKRKIKQAAGDCGSRQQALEVAGDCGNRQQALEAAGDCGSRQQALEAAGGCGST